MTALGVRSVHITVPGSEDLPDTEISVVQLAHPVLDMPALDDDVAPADEPSVVSNTPMNVVHDDHSYVDEVREARQPRTALLACDDGGTRTEKTNAR